MLINARSKNRPYHLGLFPLETLSQAPALEAEESARPPLAARPARNKPVGEFSVVARQYFDLFMQFRHGDVASAKAPVPDNLERRSIDIKGGIYFLNAAHAGICRIPANAWIEGEQIAGHNYAAVIVVENGRIAEHDNLAHDWIVDAVEETGRMKAAGIATCISNYIGQLGFAATAHVADLSNVDSDRLSILAGVTCRDKDNVVSPYLGDQITVAVVTTDYELATDLALAPTFNAGKGLRYWFGINGAESGRERNRRAKRATHMSKYPMEEVKRVDRPTTLILDDEVPRVPKRAIFFERSLQGDLGEKMARERMRFAFKHPAATSFTNMIAGMTKVQDGDVRDVDTAKYSDPAANSRAIKSLANFLGADLTGICEIPNYAWYSHKEDGTPIEPYHKYAIVMLIDQEYDTMEAASGDDWISGSQSMRAYMRGGEIAGTMGEFLRSIGFPARPQTVADSHVLQIPLILWAGLGELSRIGELVLNPYVGPRFKSVVLTTNMPLQVDKPIDFGLQYFCGNCLKCARECPCDAIPVRDKVMFNGYEIWKPDAERCVRYRLTNKKGAGCGRCMKTCPLNKVPNMDGPLLHRIGTWLGVHALWLKPILVPIAVYLDDRLGYGMRNPAKKWWLDLEVVDGVSIAAQGTNQRDLNVHRKWNTSREKIAYYNADMMPAPDATKPVPVDRKAAKAAAKILETPAEARARHAAGGVKPVHYIPTPPLNKK